MMRIFIADQQSKVRFALKVVLESQPNLQVVGSAASSQDLLMALKHIPTDMLLLDSTLPGMTLEDLVKRIHQHYPKLRTLVMSTDPQIQTSLPALGVEDYISKGEAAAYLLDTLRRHSLSMQH